MPILGYLEQGQGSRASLTRCHVLIATQDTHYSNHDAQWLTVIKTSANTQQ